jgi:hydrogenase expression/formation protein HypC
MLIVGEQPPGTWVLAFRGTAREVLSEEQATQTNGALDALAAALRGERSFDAYFSDLVDREPELPEHLRGTPR